MAKRRHVMNPGQPSHIGGGSSISGNTYSSVDIRYVFDARAGVTTSGSAVTSWAPVAGSATPLIQGTAANQPTLATSSVNGLAAIDFDGSDLLSAATTTLGFTAAAGPAITGITQANPGVITTGVPHGLSTGDYIFFDGLAGGLGAIINGQTTPVTVTGATTLQILDTSSLPAYTSGGTVDPTWKQTAIVVWRSGATPTPGGNLRGLWGWSTDSTGENYHKGYGFAHWINGGNESYFLMNGSASSYVAFQGASATNTATNVHVTAYTSDWVVPPFTGGTPSGVETYTGTTAQTALTTAVYGGLPTPMPTNFRTSAAMSCGCFAYKATVSRCLDGEIQAIYVWNRALGAIELSRTLTRIGGTWIA